MAKNDTSENARQNQPADTKPEKKDRGKQRIELPPVIEMVISIARSTVLLFAIIVALVSLNAGADVQTILIRIMVTLMGSGLVLWLVTWWITQLYFEGVVNNQRAQFEESPEGTFKDLKA